MHILERFLIHAFSATALVMAIYYALRYWVTHNQKVKLWICPDRRHLLVTSALILFALSTLREPFDYAFGYQPLYKTIFDYISWVLGAGAAVWGLYRFSNMDNE